MPEIWGMLEKSQTDSQKIDDAISTAIANHEADESAHLGENESLQSHKAEAIIDHVAGSILADKLSMTEYQARTIFEALDKWNTTGNVQNDVWPGVMLWSDYSPANPAECSTKDSIIPDYITWTKNLLFQALIRIDETINKKVFFGHGDRSGDNVTDGFGFKVVNGTLYGYLAADGTFDTVELTGVTLTNTHCYRAQWDASLKTCYYIVDGVQKGSLTVTSTSGTGDGHVLLRIEATASGECYLNVFEIFTSREI